LVVLALIAVAVGSPSPLDVRITGLRTTGQFSTVAQISVSAHNRTNRALTPRFSVNSNHASSFWYVLDRPSAGQVTVPPHQTRSFVLRAPDAQSMPQVSQDFAVEAFTRDPDAVSTSDRLRFSQALVYLTPSLVDRPVPVGQPLHLAAQLHTRFGTPITHAGTIVELGQVVYTPPGPVTAASSINSGARGRSALARTDGSGRATFTVVGLRPQDAPVFYQAWIDNAQRGPSGYSTPVLVHYYRP
jgi:hypothetical protein